ncbi:hypothetical protein P12x_005373 [Tundrisphaera lichenicola]|uniref:hypothetical protein n=1 Tax=Tundrisphaera lichenicola TaxID=2029860 RepID=UPI003EB70443
MTQDARTGRPTPPRRNFGLADAMILVAASAIGLAATGWLTDGEPLKEAWEIFSTPPQDGWTIGNILMMVGLLGITFVVPSLAAWTLACLLMRFRDPRPARRRLVRQPGAMACLIATIVIGLSVVGGLAVWATTEPDDFIRSPRLSGAMFGSTQVGAAVLWCWATMAISGRWRPEPTWLDRLGRLLGLAWIALAIAVGYVTVNFWNL